MPNFVRWLIGSCLMVSLLGCSVETAPKPGDAVSAADECPADARLSDQDLAAIRNSLADAVQHALKGDWQAFSLQFTDDIVMMPPGAPAYSGREPLRQSFSGVTLLEFVSEIDELDGCGNLAYGRGHHEWTMRLGDEGPPMSESGKWAAVWRQQADGRWLVAIDIWNGDGPPGS